MYPLPEQEVDSGDLQLCTKADEIEGRGSSDPSVDLLREGRSILWLPEVLRVTIARAGPKRKTSALGISLAPHVQARVPCAFVQTSVPCVSNVQRLVISHHS